MINLPHRRHGGQRHRLFGELVPEAQVMRVLARRASRPSLSAGSLGKSVGGRTIQVIWRGISAACHHRAEAHAA